MKFFNSTKKLASFTYANGILQTASEKISGSTLTFGYDPSGRVNRLSDSFGSFLAIDYDAVFDWIWRLTDDVGTTIKFLRNGVGTLTEIVVTYINTARWNLAENYSFDIAAEDFDVKPMDQRGTGSLGLAAADASVGAAGAPGSWRTVGKPPAAKKRPKKCRHPATGPNDECWGGPVDFSRMIAAGREACPECPECPKALVTAGHHLDENVQNFDNPRAPWGTASDTPYVGDPANNGKWDFADIAGICKNSDFSVSEIRGRVGYDNADDAVKHWPLPRMWDDGTRAGPKPHKDWYGKILGAKYTEQGKIPSRLTVAAICRQDINRFLPAHQQVKTEQLPYCSSFDFIAFTMPTTTTLPPGGTTTLPVTTTKVSGGTTTTIAVTTTTAAVTTTTLACNANPNVTTTCFGETAGSRR